MRRTGTTVVLATVLTAAAALSACSGDGAKTPGSASSSSSSSSSGGGDAAPGTTYPVAPDATASPEPALATKQARDGWVFTLTGVRRVADDRIVVEGSLDGSKATSNFSVWTEPGYKTLKGSGGQVTDGLNGEFSAVALSVAGDATTYLPVRDQENLCLCTRLGPVSVRGSAPVYVVMSAPKGATAVTVAITGAGTFANQKVSQ